jgi:pantothenate synthetase
MAARVRAVMATEVAAEPAVTLEYAELIDADRLTAPSPATTTLRLVIAARLGTTRLIDNLAV